MPRQNTCPSHFPAFVLSQIEHIAQCIVSVRKQRGETQAQWAQKLGISQPTMARLERGDPAIATATYVMCLWLVNPALDLRVLLQPHNAAPAWTTLAQPPEPPASSPAPRCAADEFAELLAQWSVPAL